MTPQFEILEDSKPPLYKGGLKRKLLKKQMMSQTQLELQPQPRVMEFLKTDNFSLNQKELSVMKKQRCTPLNGSTVPPRKCKSVMSPTEVQKIKQEKLSRRMEKWQKQQMITKEVNNKITLINQMIQLELSPEKGGPKKDI